MKKLNLEAIRLDGQTQARVALDSAQVAEYAEAIRDGETFPPIVVFHDGSDYWLADGFHRYHATKQVGHVSIEAEVRTGTVEGAQIYAFGANAKRGLSTNNEDNRSIITRMLAHPISKGWTNAEIARHVGVSKMTVGRVKTSLEPEPQRAEKTYQRKNGEKVTVDTTKLATNKPRLETAPEIEEPEVDEREQKISELVDTINELVVENQKLKDAIAVGQWDASDIEKIDVQDTIADLREQIKNLEIDNKALRDSRDMFQNRNAELLGTVKKLQSKLNKIEAVGA